MKKPVILFTIADNNPVNQKLLKGFKNSLRKFHSEEELPLRIYGQEELNKINDHMKFYRATPLFARNLIQDYQTVIKADCDQIVTGKLNHLWENTSYDLGYVLNGNPKEPAYTVWDVHPAEYANCGLVVMNSPQFVHHWWKLCVSSHFANYQFREQDLMNIMISYGDYDIKCLDFSENWHGLVAKGWYSNCVLNNRNLILKKGNQEWPMDGDKIIKLVHFAGGNDSHKGNYRIMFEPDVVKHLDWLVSDDK
jgi:hypothetical protein